MRSKRRGLWIVAVAAAAACVVAITTIGITPHPPVEPSGTAGLIRLNDVLREWGPWFLLAGAVVVLCVPRFRRLRSSSRASFAITGRTLAGVIANLGLSAVLIGTTAAGSALGDAAAGGANAPLRFLSQRFGGRPADVLDVVQFGDALPFDHAELPARATDELMQTIVKHGGQAMPYDLLLGSVDRTNTSSNPSSSAIVLLPARYLASSAVGSGCALAPMAVVANNQLAQRIGQTLSVEGEPAVVASRVAVFPGLDRGLAIGSLEQATGCITGGSFYSGLLVRGLPLTEVLTMIHELPSHYAVVGLASVEHHYRQFWDRSVKPPEMQLVLYVCIASIAGLAAMKVADVLRRRQLIAALHGAGVSRQRIARSEFSRGVADAVIAAGLAAPLALGLIVINASSQFGIAERFDLHALGAGFVVGLVASLLGALASATLIHRMDTTSTERE